MSSASAGSESVLRSSRAALVAHVESFTLNDLVQFCNGLKIVIQTHLSDDRVLVPALETMAFLLETGLLSSLQNEEFW